MDNISSSTLIGMGLLLVVALIIITAVLWNDGGSGGGGTGNTGNTGGTGCHPCDDFSSCDHSKYIIEELSRLKQEQSEMSQRYQKLQSEMKNCHSLESGTAQSVQPEVSTEKGKDQSSSDKGCVKEVTLTPAKTSTSDSDASHPPSPPCRRPLPPHHPLPPHAGEETFSLSSDFSSSRSKEHDK